jgi:hypothetical protein
MAGSGLDLGVFLVNNSEYKVRVSENDSQPNYLINKFTSSDSSVTITETNDGGVETIDLLAAGGGGDNITNANLTLDDNRIVDLDEKTLTFDNGTVIFKGESDASDENALMIKNDSEEELLSVKNFGGKTLISIPTGKLEIQDADEFEINDLNNLQITSPADYTAFDQDASKGFRFNDEGHFTGDLSVGGLTDGARFIVKGSGSTSATINAIFRNLSGDFLLKIDDSGSIYAIGNQGLNETLTFGGGSTGEVLTVTYTNGIVTGKTLVP